MNILIVSATQMEVETAMEQLNEFYFINFLISGVGMLSTAVSLTKSVLEKRPDLVLQVGIAGCFDPNVQLGNVVLVKEEILGDCGVEEKGVWNDLFKSRLKKPNDSPFSNGRLINNHLSLFSYLQLPTVSAISVNEITTSPHRILQQQLLYNPQIETMEGAALHYVCNDLKIPYLQIRGLSNYIGERDKSNWMIKEAVDNSNKVLLEIVKKSHQYFINQNG